MQPTNDTVWTSLEIVKLVVQLLSPIAVAILGFYFTRIVKSFEHFQWRNQRLIEKRIEVYDDLAPDFNDLLCYFTFVGSWKGLSPPDIVSRKRALDKKIYLAAPLFSSEFFSACTNFMDLCYSTFQGWGEDAKLRTPFERRKDAAGKKWRKSWGNCFVDDVSEPEHIQRAYQEILRVFSVDIGIASPDQIPTGSYPSGVK